MKCQDNLEMLQWLHKYGTEKKATTIANSEKPEEPNLRLSALSFPQSHQQGAQIQPQAEQSQGDQPKPNGFKKKNDKPVVVRNNNAEEVRKKMAEKGLLKKVPPPMEEEEEIPKFFKTNEQEGITQWNEPLRLLSDIKAVS